MNEDEPSPHPRQRVLFDKLKPPGRHRAQPKSGAEQRFEEAQAHNRRRSLPEKYRRKYTGRHRRGAEPGPAGSERKDS